MLGGDTHAVHSLYFESAATILTLISLGKYLEARAKGKTGDAIKALMDLSPQKGVVIKNGRETEVPASEIQPGDILICRAGESFCVDGEVTDGEASVDESMITGESIPVYKKKGDAVTGATVNKSGVVKYRAVKVGRDTVLAGIIKMVEDAQGSKAPIARLADKVAGVFVPVVLIIAAVMFTVWMAAGKDFEFSITILVSVLVIACPCALGLATPTAIMVGTAEAQRRVFFLKTPLRLKRACHAKAVAFDKTGTLTVGTPRVTDVEGKEECISLAAALERGSVHPLAKAVTEYAEEKGAKPAEAKNITEYGGMGMRADVGGAAVTVGNLDIMRQNGIDISGYDKNAEKMAENGKTPVYVASGDKVIGVIGIADEIKKGAKEAVAELAEMGIKTVMLTGDTEKTARAVSKKLGISEVISHIRPEDKAGKIQEYKQTHGRTIMVGDGINDAPALKSADVGISVGSGTDAAKSAADIIIVKNDIGDVVKAVKLSRATITNIKQNLFWAFLL